MSSGRTVVERTLRGETVDRIAVCPHWFGAFKFEHAGLARTHDDVEALRLYGSELADVDLRFYVTNEWVDTMWDRLRGEQAIRTGNAESVDSLSYDLRVRLLSFLRESSQERVLRPHLQRLLRQRAVSAWVAANDMTALACRAFLLARGVRVPHDLSLMSFDDSAEAAAARLTSYNFDCASLARMIIAFLLRPSGRRREYTPAVLEPEGFVNVRQTTGPGPAAAPQPR